jgi:hypothetical protein
MPVYLLLCFRVFAPLPLFYSFFSPKSFLALVVIMMLYTAVFPGILVFWMRRAKLVSNIEISNQVERPKVYLITSAFYISLGYFLYSKGGLLEPTSYLVFTMVINILGLGIISLKEKISAHVSAVAGILGMSIAIFIKFGEYSLFVPILFLIVLTGILASSRLILGAHNLKQIGFGFVWGFLTGFVGLYYMI